MRAMAAIDGDVGPTPAVQTGTRPGRLEGAFLHLVMIVLQGAFIITPQLIATGGMLGEEAGGSDPVNQMAFGIVLLGTLVLTLGHFRAVAGAVRQNAVYLILPALILMSTAWSLYPGLTLKRAISTDGVCLFALYAATRLTLDELLTIVSRTLLLSILASVAIALALPNVGREMGPGLDGEWRGVFAQKNQLGHVMAVGCAVQLVTMLRAARPRRGAVLIFLGCLALAVLSRSATSLLSILVAVALTVTYACVRRGRVAMLIGAPLAAAGLCLVLAIATQSSVLALLDRDSTLTGRTDLWPVVLQMIEMRPWTGWGFEAFWTENNPLYDYVQHTAGWPAPNAHNGLLEVAIDLGLIGAAALIIVLGWSLKRAIGAMARGELIGIAVLILLFMLIVGNITESFILQGSVFGWNLFTMLVFMTGLRAAAPRPAVVATSLLGRAKPRTAHSLAADPAK